MLKVEWDITDEELERFNSRNNHINNMRHVHYDPNTGIIQSITSEVDNNLPFVLVEFDNVKDILEGKDFVENYKIAFSPDEKDFVFIKKDEQEELLESINDVIFQIPVHFETSYPVIYDSLNDLTIVQDLHDTCWKFYINGGLANSLKTKNLYFDRYFDFYITDFNDPNILHKTLSISVNELLKNFYVILPFDEDDYQEYRFSVYTRKLFFKYQCIKAVK